MTWRSLQRDRGSPGVDDDVRTEGWAPASGNHAVLGGPASKAPAGNPIEGYVEVRRFGGAREGNGPGRGARR